MAIGSDGSLSVVVRSWTLMIFFCFAGCAAGSCLSYGHACWGAHGKRSTAQTINVHLIPRKTTTSDSQQDVQFPYGKEEWIMSRLIDGRRFMTLPDKYRDEWNPQQTERNVRQGKWSRARLNKRVGSDEHEEEESERRDNETTDFGSDEKSDRYEAPEIILISRSNYQKEANKPENIDLFKLLTKANEYFD